MLLKSNILFPPGPFKKSNGGVGIPPTPPTPLLDAYPSTYMACSLSKLKTTPTTPCIEIRRDSDNARTDIGFSGDWVDMAAVASFCGLANGFVRTFYDQTAGGRDMVDIATTRQPQIWDGALSKDTPIKTVILLCGHMSTPTG